MTHLKARERAMLDLRSKLSHTPKKRNFDETRQLILKLEEAEREIRARESPRHDNSNETIKQKLSSSRKQQREITF